MITEIKPHEGKIIIYVDMESKNSHTFQDGTVIRLERQYNNLNRRETEPVNATVLSHDYIPKGSKVLIHHNAIHDVHRLFNLGELSGIDKGNDIRYFSIGEHQCFLWQDKNGEWQPCKGFATALRVFIPYTGTLEGIEPTLIPNTLYITSGELKGKVCRVLKASDYEVIFQGDNGREQRIIRCRHFENEVNDREEITAIDYYATKKLKNGEYFVGLSKSDCKPLK